MESFDDVANEEILPMGAGSGLAEAIDETALLRADRCRDTIYATGSSTVKATV